MQVSTSRQLSARSKGELSWVVGPLPARAMVLGVTTRFKKVQTAVGLEVTSHHLHHKTLLPVAKAEAKAGLCQCACYSLAPPFVFIFL